MKQLSKSEKFFFLTVFLGFLHHVDHVLRADHSGWPFQPTVSPLTFSLLFYPIFLSVYFARSKPWYRVLAMTGIYLVLQLLHIFRETPQDQFHTWAYNRSDLPEALGNPNLFNIASPLLGTMAAILSILLSLSFLITIYYFIQDARKQKK